MWNHKSVQRLIEIHGISDPILIVKNLARNLVLDAFTRGWDGPPFDPIELAKHLKLDIMPNNDINDARILPLKSNSFRIEYNPNQRVTRTNFSIAHEIGHTFFPDCGEIVRNRETKLETHFNELEFLCDIAAAEILLPYAEFTNEANSVPLTMQSLIDISKKYQASLTSVFLRFCEVVNKSCSILICHLSNNNRLVLDYSKKSNASELEVPINLIIPEDSSAYECLSPGWTSYKKESWKIMNYETYNVFSIGLAPIRNSTEKRIGILLVPEHYKDEPDNKINTVYGDATKPRGSGKKIIGQVVNTYAGLGAGFGKAMKKRFPIIQDALVAWKSQKEDFKLGKSQFINIDKDVYVFQMLAQKGLFPTKNNPLPLNYNALRECLRDLSVISLDMDATVHLPLIGAGQAKGTWEIIEGIIYDELIIKGIQVTIYILPGSKIINSRKSVLTTFNENSLYESK